MSGFDTTVCGVVSDVNNTRAERFDPVDALRAE